MELQILFFAGKYKKKFFRDDWHFNWQFMDSMPLEIDNLVETDLLNPVVSGLINQTEGYLLRFGSGSLTRPPSVAMLSNVAERGGW